MATTSTASTKGTSITTIRTTATIMARSSSYRPDQRETSASLRPRCSTRRGLLLGLGLILSTKAAEAHTRLVSSDPRHAATLARAPTRAVLRFSSGIEPRFSRLELVESGGVTPLSLDTVAEGLVREISATLPPLAAGPHQLRYDVVAADGHRVRGSIHFSVQ